MATNRESHDELVEKFRRNRPAPVVATGPGVTLERCRELLPDVELTDEQLLEFREELYWLAEGAVEMALAKFRAEQPDPDPAE